MPTAIAQLAEAQIMYISPEAWESNLSLVEERKLRGERTGAALDPGQEECEGFQWEEVEAEPSWAEEIV